MAKSKWFPEPTEPVAHLQRKPGETFEQMAERMGYPMQPLEREIRHGDVTKKGFRR